MVRFNYDKMRVECDKCGELNNDKYEIVENEDGYSILCHQALNIIGVNNIGGRKVSDCKQSEYYCDGFAVVDTGIWPSVMN
jgi:hypothetical protein